MKQCGKGKGEETGLQKRQKGSGKATKRRKKRVRKIAMKKTPTVSIYPKRKNGDYWVPISDAINADKHVSVANNFGNSFIKRLDVKINREGGIHFWEYISLPSLH